MTSNVTVAIINYNGENTLEPTIKSILEQKPLPPARILLLDNNSTDMSVKLVSEKYPQIETHKLPENKGPNPARNMALQMATTDYVLIMDNDIILAPDYIEKIVNTFQKYPNAGAISGQIRLYEQPEKMQYNGAFIHYAGEVILNKKILEEPICVPCVSAGAALFNRKRAIEIGGFDEDFFIGWEDGDLTFRLSMAGNFSYAVSNALCFHIKRKRGFKWVRFQVRNRLWFIMKNYQKRTILLALPAIALFQLSSFLFFAIKGEMKSVLQGWLDAFKTRKDVLLKRKKVQSFRKVPDIILLQGGMPDLICDSVRNPIVNLCSYIVGILLGFYWFLIKPFLKRI